MMVALSMTVIVTCTALTVDLGRVSVLRRDLQNVADAAALDLARALDGETAAAVLASWRGQDAVAKTLARNDFEEGGSRVVEVAVGDYDAVADEFSVYAVYPFDVVIDDPPTAVRVRVFDRVDYAFAPGGNTTSRHAIATRSDPIAGIQIGSFAARLDTTDSPLLGPLLGPLGGQAGLDVLSYQGLADVSVGFDALATELGLSVADPDGLLGSQVTLARLIEAQADILEDHGLLTEANFLRDLRGLVVQLPNPPPPIALGDLLAVTTGGEAAAADAHVNVVDLILASAFVANGAHAVRIPGLAAEVPGVTALGADVTLIERPRWVFGPRGTQVETSQVRLDLDGTLLPTIGGAFAPLLSLDLAVDVASGRARIADIVCNPEASSLDVGVLGGLATASGTITVNLFDGLAPVVVGVSLAPGAGGEVLVPFDLPPDPVGVAKQVGGPEGLLLMPNLSVELPSLDSLGDGALRDLVEGLEDLGIDLDLLGLDEVADLIDDLLGGILGPILGGGATRAQLLAGLEDVIDALVAELTSAVLPALFEQLDALVDPLLSLLGITAPGADVTPLGIECGGLKLVA